MKNSFFIMVLLGISPGLSAQTDTKPGTFWHPKLANYEVRHAIEIE